MNQSEQLIDHEVRIRLLEKAIIDIANNFTKVDGKFDKFDNKLDKLEAKMDSQFHWILGIIITFIVMNTTIFGGIILHLAKLI